MDDLMSIVWYSIHMTLVFEEMEKRADIGIGEVFTFEPDGGDKVLLMISCSGFGEETFGFELKLFLEEADFICVG
jgi:hypothetical protein